MALKPRPMGAVELALEQQLFGRFTTVERVVSIADASIRLLNNNPERMGWVIVNTAPQQLTFRLQPGVVSGEGFILVNNGDTASTTYLEDGQFPTHEINIIAAAAGGECFVIEFIRDAL